MLSLFLSFHYIKFLQYNIRFLPTSETPNSKSIIRKPWSKNPNHGLNTIHLKSVKKTQFFYRGGSALKLWNLCCGYGFGSNSPKLIGGSQVGYPPLARPLQAHRVCRLVNLGVKLHAKNITHTQQ